MTYSDKREGTFVGLFSPGGSSLGNVSGLAFDRNTGTLYGIDGTNALLVAINATTGEATTVGPVGFDASDVGLAFDPTSDTLYASDGSFNRLFTGRLKHTLGERVSAVE